ncbi:MAG: glycine zipper 2TM domain-containing protein [Zoogloeaceae bacterium]|nr:glycine zipper 2TM domain-containing protein [Zoogloeaceae bacterium]
MSKQGQGTVIGAVVGAAAGSAVDGKRGAAIGAVLGGFLGNRIGAYLDERDLEMLKKLEQEALKSDQPKSFTAQKSGETVTITPGPEEREIVRYGLSPNIREYGLTPADSETTIRAYVDTPVYASADARQTPRLVLKAGDVLFVPVLVADKPGWGAAVEKTVVVGYVPLSYLDEEKARHYKAAAPQAKKRATPTSASTTEAKAPEAAPSVPASASAEPAPPVVVVRAPADEAPVKQVDVALKCKVTTVRIKGVPEETTRYCQKPPPRWVKT